MGQPCVSCSLWSASYRLGEKFDQMSDQSRGVGGLSAVDRPRFSFVSFNTKRSVDSSLLALGEREIYHFDFSEGQAVVSSPKVDYQRWLVSILRVSTALVWNTGHVTYWTRLLPGPGTKGGVHQRPPHGQLGLRTGYISRVASAESSSEIDESGLVRGFLFDEDKQENDETNTSSDDGDVRFNSLDFIFHRSMGQRRYFLRYFTCEYSFPRNKRLTDG